MKRILFLFLLLPACGQSSPADNNYGFGFAFDQQSEATGIRVRYSPSGFSPSIEEIDATYALAHSFCGVVVDTVLPGPLVLIVDFDNERVGLPSSQSVGGVYVPETKTVLIKPASNFSELQHEFRHYILHVTFGDHDGDHSSTLWPPC